MESKQYLVRVLGIVVLVLFSGCKSYIDGYTDGYQSAQQRCTLGLDELQETCLESIEKVQRSCLRDINETAKKCGCIPKDQRTLRGEQEDWDCRHDIDLNCPDGKPWHIP